MSWLPYYRFPRTINIALYTACIYISSLRHAIKWSIFIFSKLTSTNTNPTNLLGTMSYFRPSPCPISIQGKLPVSWAYITNSFSILSIVWVLFYSKPTNNKQRTQPSTIGFDNYWEWIRDEYLTHHTTPTHYWELGSPPSIQTYVLPTPIIVAYINYKLTIPFLYLIYHSHLLFIPNFISFYVFSVLNINWFHMIILFHNLSSLKKKW